MPMGRRRFSQEFKVSAVRLVTEQGYSPAQAAKSLGVDPASLHAWLKKFAPAPEDAQLGSQGTVQAELRQLREEVRRLTMEREILKKATAFFAKESP